MAKRVESWVVTDQFWQRVEPLAPQRAPSPNKQYVRKPGAGRPAKPARQVFEGIVYVLRTGCQWKALPAERFGRASAIYKRFLEWEKVGFFESLWKAGLAEYDDMEGIAWRWQSVDGALMKKHDICRPTRPKARLRPARTPPRRTRSSRPPA